MLPPMERKTLLMRRQPTEKAQIDVAVMPRDVDVGVMKHDMLPVPQVGAAAEQIERHRHQLVDPRRTRVGFVSAVVLNVEADLHGRQPRVPA